MSNRSPKILWPIDYSSMTHRLVIDYYYSAQERHFYCFLLPFFLVCDFFSCDRQSSEKFLSTMSRHKVLITDTDDSQLCNISLKNISLTNGKEIMENRLLKLNFYVLLAEKT